MSGTHLSVPSGDQSGSFRWVSTFWKCWLNSLDVLFTCFFAAVVIQSWSWRIDVCVCCYPINKSWSLSPLRWLRHVCSTLLSSPGLVSPSLFIIMKYFIIYRMVSSGYFSYKRWITSCTFIATSASFCSHVRLYHHCLFTGFSLTSCATVYSKPSPLRSLPRGPLVGICFPYEAYSFSCYMTCF